MSTGQAGPGRSDIDLLTVGLPPSDAAALGAELTERFAGLCRGVEIAPMQPADLVGEEAPRYGDRVFLRHYCVRLAGPDRAEHDGFPADARAARGFNGDIAMHARRWQAARDDGGACAALARRVARKTLLAVAGLVSVHDRTWTTDRGAAAHRWAQIDPAARVTRLLPWCEPDPGPVDPAELDAVLRETVAPVVDAFAATIGLWDTGPT